MSQTFKILLLTSGKIVGKVRRVFGACACLGNNAVLTKRVRTWHDVDPFYTDQASGLPKTSESRGTESILNALILVWRDAPTGHLSAMPGWRSTTCGRFNSKLA